MAPGSTQPLTLMSTTNLPEGKGAADCLENVGALMFHKPIGLHDLLQG
jgi:hypothetical protein